MFTFNTSNPPVPGKHYWRSYKFGSSKPAWSSQSSSSFTFTADTTDGIYYVETVFVPAWMSVFGLTPNDQPPQNSSQASTIWDAFITNSISDISALVVSNFEIKMPTVDGDSIYVICPGSSAKFSIASGCDTLLWQISEYEKAQFVKATGDSLKSFSTKELISPRKSGIEIQVSGDGPDGWIKLTVSKYSGGCMAKDRVVYIRVGKPESPTAIASSCDPKDSYPQDGLNLCIDDNTTFTPLMPHPNYVFGVHFNLEWKSSDLSKLTLGKSYVRQIGNHLRTGHAVGEGFVGVTARAVNACGWAEVNRNILIDPCENADYSCSLGILVRRFKNPDFGGGWSIEDLMPDWDNLFPDDEDNPYPDWGDLFPVWWDTSSENVRYHEALGRYVPQFSNLYARESNSFTPTFHNVMALKWHHVSDTNQYSKSSHVIGTYSVKLKSLSNGQTVFFDTANTSRALFYLNGIAPNDYQIEITSGNNRFLDTVKVLSSCTSGNCFMGQAQSGGIEQLSPMIYPNPGAVDMSLAFFEPSGMPPAPTHSIGYNYTLSIFDMQNNLQAVQTSDKQLINFSVMSLQNGLYIVKLSDGVNEYIWRYIKQ